MPSSTTSELRLAPQHLAAACWTVEHIAASCFKPTVREEPLQQLHTHLSTAFFWPSAQLRAHEPASLQSFVDIIHHRDFKVASTLHGGGPLFTMDLHHPGHLPVHTVASHGQTRTAWTAQVRFGPRCSVLLVFCFLLPPVSATARQEHAFRLNARWQTLFKVLRFPTGSGCRLAMTALPDNLFLLPYCLVLLLLIPTGGCHPQVSCSLR